MTQVNYYWICFPCSTDTYLYTDATMTVGTLIKAKDEACLRESCIFSGENFTATLNLLSFSTQSAQFLRHIVFPERYQYEYSMW